MPIFLKVSHALAKEKCSNKNMSLLSTETTVEKDVVANFLAQNGAQLNYLNYLPTAFMFCLGLSADMLWTSLSKVNGGLFTWLGGVENSLEETANITGGDCVAMKGKSLQGAACDANFPYVCEKNPPVYALLRSCFHLL